MNDLLTELQTSQYLKGWDNSVLFITLAMFNCLGSLAFYLQPLIQYQ